MSRQRVGLALRVITKTMVDSGVHVDCVTMSVIVLPGTLNVVEKIQVGWWTDKKTLHFHVPAPLDSNSFGRVKEPWRVWQNKKRVWPGERVKDRS